MTGRLGEPSSQRAPIPSGRLTRVVDLIREGGAFAAIPSGVLAIVCQGLDPNFKDTEPGVWTWKLEPVAPNLGRAAGDIIDTDVPIHVGTEEARQQLADFRNEIKKRLAAHEANRPPVVRFAQPGRYAGCLGPSERLRVCASHLEPLINQTAGRRAPLGLPAHRHGRRQRP